VEIPVNSEPRTGLSMGEHQAITAKQMGIKRVDQDELAAASHNNMAAAYDRALSTDAASTRPSHTPTSSSLNAGTTSGTRIPRLRAVAWLKKSG